VAEWSSGVIYLFAYADWDVEDFYLAALAFSCPVSIATMTREKKVQREKARQATWREELWKRVKHDILLS
jgi:hypothetical protein